MKRKTITVIFLFIIFLLASFVLFNKKSEEKELTKVKVADTTLTSWSCGS